jgi:alkylation response protein AidB-like acyl-CoA dehydrogenase
MEMTIARDRWQLHLKTRGGYYAERAGALRAAAGGSDESGAATAADALDALSALLEQARVERLTRNQHVLFRIGELVAWAETAEVFARRARAALDGDLPEKADRRFEPRVLAAMSRVFARDAALRVVTDGLRWITGASAADAAAFASRLSAERIYGAQAGVLDDLQFVADALYHRNS